MKNNILDENFNVAKIFKFTLPTVLMMVFTSLYCIVDGLFISKFIGTMAFSAINIIYPGLNIILGIGIMLGTGASAEIGKWLGEGEIQKANSRFSLLIVVTFLIGILLLIIIYFTKNNIIYFLGANYQTFNYCLDYLTISCYFIPLMLLQLVFNSIFVTAGKPLLGMIISILGGIINIIFDYIFIVFCSMGLTGAAIASGMGMTFTSVFGVLYFIFSKNILHFSKIKFDGKFIFKSCSNGSSEMVSNCAAAITEFLFNYKLLQLVGNEGVAAIGIVLYIEFLIMSMIIGFSTGIAPVISYKYGKMDKVQLRQLFKNNITMIAIFSISVFLLSYFLSPFVIKLFAYNNNYVYNMTVKAMKLFSISFVFMGINIYASSMFTAYANGLVSAIISFLRTLLFTVVCLLILPEVMGITGVWLAVPIAEIITFVISITFIIVYRKKYYYSRN